MFVALFVVQLIYVRPKATQEALYWLTFNGTLQIFEICEAMISLGFASKVVEYLSWNILCLEAAVTLCTVKYLPWRVRQYCLVAKCYDEINDVEAAAGTVDRAIKSINFLLELESLDPPVPPDVLNVLDTCTQRMKILKFKYDTLNNPALIKIDEGATIGE